MQDFNLSKLPWGGKLAVTAFIAAVGVGYLFAFAQLRNAHHGSLSYSQVVRDYYGRPAVRDSLETYWEGVRADLVTKWANGQRGPIEQSAAPSTGAFSLDDLDAFDEPAPAASRYDRLLARATNEGDLEELIANEKESDLMVKLGIPSVAQLVSLGHTHSFGQSGFFFPVALLLLLTSLPWNIKGPIAALPFIGIATEFPAALLTRLYSPAFAGILLLAGALMAIGYTACFVLVMYELWIKPLIGGKRADDTAQG